MPLRRRGVGGGRRDPITGSSRIRAGALRWGGGRLSTGPAAITDSKKTQKNVTRSSYRPLSSFLARLSTTITTPPILVMSTVLNRRNINVNGCCE